MASSQCSPPPRPSSSLSREPHLPGRYRLTLQAEPRLMRCVSPQSERRPQLAIVHSGASISSNPIERSTSEMTTNVLVTFYSTYGHVHRMALAVAEGAESVPDSTVQLRRIAELEDARKALSAQDAYVRAQQAQANIPVVTHDDLRWADGIAWGTPTRYGNMSAQMKQFVDTDWPPLSGPGGMLVYGWRLRQ